MIDTIRFKIPVPPDVLDIIKKKSLEISKVDNSTSTDLFRYYTSDIELGSYDRNVNFFINSEDICFIELSLPKLYQGFNITLLSFQQCLEAIDVLYSKLVEKFSVFPPVSTWIIERLDLPYAWKLSSLESSLFFINYLKSRDFVRKTKTTYPTSVMFTGRTYSVKFYDKHSEFYHHDFKYLKYINEYDLAERLYSLSVGVLRFEVTLRKPALLQYFGEPDLKVSDLNEANLSSTIQVIFYKMFKNNTDFMDQKKIVDKLTARYGATEGLDLATFYDWLTSKDESKKQLLRRIPRRTYYRKIKKIRDANVGLHIDNSQLKFDFNIPSLDVVNT